ncbi:ficolin-1-like [Drosophila bipectinata]|uniref:ficolin-1-like n=1 Tax=Drosophila bipectinata TaxID=42026 RepID=UPI001C89F8A9|nr:ficolin-1-like [Drosophila bipectinata]
MKSSVVVVILYILLHQKNNFVIADTAENVSDTNEFQNCEEFCYLNSEFLKIVFDNHDRHNKGTMRFEQDTPHKNSKDIKGLRYATRWLTNQLSHCNAKKEISNVPPYNQKEIYKMKLRGMKHFHGPCASGPGWIVVQRRFDGSVDFNRTWNEYKEGFGNIQGEYFIGLDRLHLMTSSSQHELCVRIADTDGDSAHAHYTHFEIGDEEESYKLKYIEGYSGTAGNYIAKNKNMKFSTIDRDNDMVNHNCAKSLNGWWYNDCYENALNGPYDEDGKSPRDGGIMWLWKRDFSRSVTFAEMMIKSKNI